MMNNIAYWVSGKSAMRLPAPAKLNLFLHVVGRRTDGKHLLQSIFTLIDLVDEIDLVVQTNGVIQRTGDLLSSPEKDLCVRAAKKLREVAGVPSLGALINVRKRIPAGAGMGGGSSDAATTLIGLNLLWGLGFSRSQLMAIAESLGADVPFFIWGRSGFVEGIGERISPITVPVADYEVIWPGKGVSTAQIFAAPNLTRDSESSKMAVFSDLIRDHWPALPGHNDLQPVAEAVEPMIAQARQVLADAGLCPRMTGSGSAVFAIASGHRIDSTLLDLPAEWFRFRVRGLQEHPLAAWVS